MPESKSTPASTPRHGYDPFYFLKWGGLLLGIVLVFSTAFYYCVGLYYHKADWSLLHCLFMVVITLTTIGYGDWLDIRDIPIAEIFTMLLAMIGVGVPAFVISNVTALIVEGMFRDEWRRRKMEKKILEMRGHVVVCGVGSTGLHIAEELVKTKRVFVAIDTDEARLKRAQEQLGDFPYIVGSAEDDPILVKAGVEHASGLVASLAEDKDNLFITLTARRMNPKLRIISKVVEMSAGPKLLAAGADRFVCPTAVGGLRMVSELVRPSVVTFLDTMLRDPAEAYRFEEITIIEGSEYIGKTLATCNLRQVGNLLVVAGRAPGVEKFTYNPTADFPLVVGTTLVLLGSSAEMNKVRTLLTTAVK